MINLKERNLGTLVLVVIIGILIGSYASSLIALVPGSNNVVKMIFTYNFISFGLGFPHPLYLDLSAVKFQIGFQMKFNALSVIGLFISLYFFRWYK
ncbi:MAG TPA: DUF4321 domain-containing protein [Chitinivibrionales bacterium]